MKYTADFLIEKRREKWEKSGDIEEDRRFREAVAAELVTNRELLLEVRKSPEKLIELVFVVVDKKQKTMPFFLNAVQRDFVARLNRAIIDFEAGTIPEISILVLKGRQQGFTTVVTAYQLACTVLNRNVQGFTLADTTDNAEEIFQKKAKFPYSYLPETLKPTEKFNNRKQLLFERINSSWTVATATKDVGRSKTVNIFHGSECAFWQTGIEPIQAALGEAFTQNCIKIFESTANGFNDFQKMWDSGVHINCFYEWWRTPEYAVKPGNKEIEEEFVHSIDTKADWIWERLRWLRDGKGLHLHQLYWYYNKFIHYINKDTIKQEYPCSPQEAFLLSGKNVFDTAVLLRRLDEIEKPLQRGYFTYDYDGLHIRNIRWVPDRNGYIKLYKKPNTPAITKYCIGGDTAGDGSDYFTAHVLDARTGEQVAVMKHQFDADQYAHQIYCLGKYYRCKKANINDSITSLDALIGIEANFDSYPIRELERLGYRHQYVRDATDAFTGKVVKKYGFRTDRLTRPTVISRLIEVVRDHSHLINDRDTIEELLTIVRNEKGRIEAPEGGHDDQMMGLAIAHHVREQVSFAQEAIAVPARDEFDLDEYDDGETITVI